MKSQTILLAGLLALSASVASATTTKVHFTGSTAFRSATHNAIYNYLSSLSGYTVEADYVGSSFNGASSAIFNASNGTDSIVVYTKWSGSDQGILDTATPNTLTWLDSSNLTGTAGIHAISGSGSFTESSAPDVAMADNSQLESTHTGGSFISLSDTPVGVVPFVWVKGSSNNTTVATSLANVTNISSGQIKAILGGGNILSPSSGAVAPLSQLTGNSADVSIPAIVFGRDSGSGTRLNAFTESGFGYTSVPMQYTATVTSGQITAVTLNSSGNAGYSSGGTLIGVLNSPVASTENYAPFGYAGISDAATLTGAGFNSTTGAFSGSNILTYNGVPFSYAAVREGAYSLWNYEQLLALPTLGGTAATTVSGIATEITNNTATLSGVKLGTMDVFRIDVSSVIYANVPPTVL